MNPNPKHGPKDLGVIPPFNSLQHTPKYTRERLKSYRVKGDLYADAVVAELHRTNGLTNIHDLLGLVRERAKEGEKNNVYSKFLSEVARVPSWVNVDVVEEGQKVQARYSGVMGTSLFAGSLVGGSMFKSAALVTAKAGNLSNEPARRTNETALIIGQLAFPHSLVSPTGKCREALTRVRLLHAGLRHWLVTSGRYTRTDEVAINQHDLSITLSLFGYLNLRSLALMNVHLSKKEQDCYMHMWAFAGFILGIEESILPESLLDQEEFFLASCVDEAKPNWIPEAVKFVLDDVAKETSKGTYNILPYAVAQTFLHQMTRYLMGNDYVTGMKIEDLGDTSYPIRVAKAMGSITTFTVNYLPFGEPMVRNLNIFMVKKMVSDHEKKMNGKLGGKINVAEDSTTKMRQHQQQQPPQARL